MSPDAEHSARRRQWPGWLLAGIFWLLAAVTVNSLHRSVADNSGGDLYQMWVGGDVVRTHRVQGRAGVLNPYDEYASYHFAAEYGKLAQGKSLRQRQAAAQWSRMETVSSPFLYSVMSVLAAADYDRVYKIYLIIALGCLMAAIAAAGWRLKYSLAGIGAAVGLAASGAPVFSDFHVTNINCPELLICTLYLLLRDKGRGGGRLSSPAFILGGVLMGLLAALKPNIVLSPLFLAFAGVIARQWRMVIFESLGFVVAFIAAIAIGAYCFGGLQAWFLWLHAIRALAGVPSLLSDYGNFSIPEMIYENTNLDITLPLTLTLMAVAVGVIWVGQRRERRRDRSSDTIENSEAMVRVSCLSHRADIHLWHDIAIFTIGTAVAFLDSGLAWVHYSILIFPFLLLLGSPAYGGRIGIWPNFCRYVLLFFILVLLMLPTPDGLQSFLPFHLKITPALWVHCSQAAIGLVLCAGLWFEFWLLPRMKSA